MNVEMLRKEYDKLTPFERAAMITRESVGLKRDSEIEALLLPLCLMPFGQRHGTVTFSM